MWQLNIFLLLVQGFRRVVGGNSINSFLMILLRKLLEYLGFFVINDDDFDVFLYGWIDDVMIVDEYFDIWQVCWGQFGVFGMVGLQQSVVNWIVDVVGFKVEFVEFFVGEYWVVDVDVSVSFGEDVNSWENFGESSFFDFVLIGSVKDDNFFIGQIIEY